jgi:hypothetical protein
LRPQPCVPRKAALGFANCALPASPPRAGMAIVGAARGRHPLANAAKTLEWLTFRRCAGPGNPRGGRDLQTSQPQGPATKSAMPAPSSARRNLLEPAKDDLQHLCQTIQAVAGGRLPDAALPSPGLKLESSVPNRHSRPPSRCRQPHHGNSAITLWEVPDNALQRYCERQSRSAALVTWPQPFERIHPPAGAMCQDCRETMRQA